MLRHLRKALPLLALLGIGAALYALGAHSLVAPERLVAEHERLATLITAAPISARLVLLGVFTGAVATGMPGTVVLVFAAGFLFGVAEATLWTTVGLTLGSLLLFLASRRAFRSGRRAPPPRVERLRVGYLRSPFSYTLFLRLIPVLPYGITTLTLAWLRCPLPIFIATSLLGGSVMLAFETAIGAGLADHLASGRALGPALLLEPRILIPVAVLAALALVPAVITRLRRRR